MVLGTLIGQGIVKSEHRQQFVKTFFTFEQTDESKALEQFKQYIFALSKKITA